MDRARRTLTVSLIALVAVAACALAGSPVRFGLITDTHSHDVDSPLEGKWMTHTEARIGAFVDAMNDWSPDFVIELGDFVNGWVVLGAEPGDPARIPDILRWTEGLYAAFAGPRYHVIGNHDLYNLDKAQYLEILGMAATSYSFDVRGVHFVVLDVQYAEDGSDLAYTYTGVSGYVPPALLDWLQEDLENSTAPTVLFVHQPLDDYIDAWERPTVLNQADVRALLSADPDVIAVFQGHDHVNRYQLFDGIHFITFAALVDQDTPPSWAQVTIDPEDGELVIEGAGLQESYRLHFGRQE